MAFIDEIRGIAILLVVLVHVAQRINISSDVLNFFADMVKPACNCFLLHPHIHSALLLKTGLGRVVGC